MSFEHLLCSSYIPRKVGYLDMVAAIRISLSREARHLNQQLQYNMIRTITEMLQEHSRGAFNLGAVGITESFLEVTSALSFERLGRKMWRKHSKNHSTCWNYKYLSSILRAERS